MENIISWLLTYIIVMSVIIVSQLLSKGYRDLLILVGIIGSCIIVPELIGFVMIIIILALLGDI